ncbi:MAG: hypothetical protein KAJ63_11700 [Methyloprofundus sp.]|nr:hypothetical protein [Methyloprofundus sp.]
MQESFLNYAHFRYLKLALALSVLSLTLYIFHDPGVAPPNGGTWLGYLLGSISAGIICLLLWFGIRKRSYSSTAGTVKGWLSAHIYLGIALIFVGTLHTGFQFGWNVHTLAYTLMILVILSGFYGLYVYIRYPTLLNTHRNGVNRLEMLKEINELDELALSISNEELNPNIHEIILRSIEKTRIGTSVWQQLTAMKYGKDPFEGIEQWVTDNQQEVEDKTLMLDSNPPSANASNAEATMIYISHALNVIDSGQLESVRRLMDAVGRKKLLIKQVRRDIQLKAQLQFWLYIHIPFSIALFAALIIHIFSVFFYW